MRSFEERRRCVLRLVDAAATLRRDEALVREVVTASGLSPEGVRWALEHHLERAPSERDLAALLEIEQEEAVGVVLSANVFTAALRALALAVASAPRVLVKPSRREGVLARRLVAIADDVGLELVPDLASLERGAVHVYGRDETIAAIRSTVGPGVRVVGHGAGFGVAYVDPATRLEDAAERLAQDVIAFDQRGCLSPRVALVEGDEARSLTFARALHEALERYEARVPRGALSSDERASAQRYADTWAFAGATLAAATHLVAIGATLDLPPPGRHVHITPVVDAAAAKALLAPVARYVVCFGADTPHAASVAPPHARIATLGQMQRPPLDGPVDRRQGS